MVVIPQLDCGIQEEETSATGSETKDTGLPCRACAEFTEVPGNDRIETKFVILQLDWRIQGF